LTQLSLGLTQLSLNSVKLDPRLLVNSLELGGPLGTRALELAARSARLAHELLREAAHLPPGGALLAIADAQLPP
jgi:hypothetical protein